MKNIKKRILALWLSVCMALTMMPSMALPVWAEEIATDDITNAITVAENGTVTIETSYSQTGEQYKYALLSESKVEAAKSAGWDSDSTDETAAKTPTGASEWNELDSGTTKLDKSANGKWLFVIDVDGESKVKGFGEKQITSNYIKDTSETPTSVAFAAADNADMKKLEVTLSQSPNVGDVVTVYNNISGDAGKKEYNVELGMIDNQKINVTLAEDPGKEVYVTYTDKKNDKLESERQVSSGHKSTDASLQSVKVQPTGEPSSIVVSGAADTYEGVTAPMTVAIPFNEGGTNSSVSITAEATSANAKVEAKLDEGTEVNFEGGSSQTATLVSQKVTTEKPITIGIKVTAESGLEKFYKLNISMTPGSTTAALTGVEVAGASIQPQLPSQYSGKKDAPEELTATIPYNEAAQNPQVTLTIEGDEAKAYTSDSDPKGTWTSVNTEYQSEPKLTVSGVQNGTPKTVWIKVVPQDYSDESNIKYYKLTISMAAPDTTADVTDIKINDTSVTGEIGNTATGAYSSPEELNITLPYSRSKSGNTLKVYAPQTAKSVMYKLAGENDEPDTGLTWDGEGYWKAEDLDFSENTTVTIEVIAQDNEHKTYFQVNVGYEEGSSEAKLAGVTIDSTSATVSEDLQHNQTAYDSAESIGTITLPYKANKDECELTVTASANAVVQYAAGAEAANPTTSLNEDPKGSGTFKTSEADVDLSTNKVITISVQSQDGTATHYYQLSVEWEKDTSVALTKVTVGNDNVEPREELKDTGTKTAPYALHFTVPYNKVDPRTSMSVKLTGPATAKVKYVAGSDASSVLYDNEQSLKTEVTISAQDLSEDHLFVEVTAEDEETTAYYELIVEMESPQGNIPIKDLTVAGYTAELDEATKDYDGQTDDQAICYTVTVPAKTEVSNVTAEFTVSTLADKVEYAVAENSASLGNQKENSTFRENGKIKADSLNFGTTNTLFIKVYAQDGETYFLYKVTIAEKEYEVGTGKAETEVNVTDVNVQSSVNSSVAATNLSTTDEASKVTVNETVMAAADKLIASQSIDLTKGESSSEGLWEVLEKAGVQGVSQADDIHVFAVPYLDIEVGENGYAQNAATYTLDITPRYYLAATTASNANSIDFNNSKNAVKLNKGDEDPILTLNAGDEVVVDITLPTGFDADATVYVKIGDDTSEKKYTAEGSIIKVTFEHFCPVVINKNAEGVAMLGSVVYPTLQAAVNAVTTENNTITLLKETSEKATVNKTGTIILKADASGWSGATADELKALLQPGTGLKLAENSPSGDDVTSGGVTFTFETDPNYRPTTPGGSTTPQPSNTVNVTSPVNGKFTISDPNAKAGDTVTVKTEPNEGYVVDQVTVTDKNGAAVEVKDNGDGTYSFTMPEDAAQPVTVSVTFKEDEGGEVTPPTADPLVFSSKAQERDIANRLTTSKDTSLKLKAADEDVTIGKLAEWDVTSDNEDVVKVLKPSNKLRYMDVGKANITVKATGSNDKVYSIVIPISVKLGTPTFTLSHYSSKKARTFTVTTSTVRGATGFQVKYSLKKSLKSSKTKTYKCGKKLIRKTIKANKSRRTYYVRVRAYKTVDGKRTYGAWSKLTKTIRSR